MEDQKVNPTSDQDEKLLNPLEDEGAAQKPAEGAGEAEVKEKEAPPKSYSEQEHQDELKQRLEGLQSTKDKEIGTITQTLEELQGKFVTLQSQTEEADFAKWLKSVEDEGGDVKAAQQIVNAQREVGNRQRTLDKREQGISAQDTKTQAAMKVLVVQDLIKKYELGEDVAKDLLDSETPMEAENKALKLQVEKLAGDQKPAVKVPSGVGSMRGLDLSAMSGSQKLGHAIEESEESRK